MDQRPSCFSPHTLAPMKADISFCCHPSSEAFLKHRETVDDFLWMGREGLMMTGTKSVSLFLLNLSARFG